MKLKMYIVSGLLLTTCVFWGEVQKHPTAYAFQNKTVPILTPQQVAENTKSLMIGRAAAKELDVGNYAEAESDAHQALAMGDASGVCDEVLAQALLDQGKYKEALTAFQTILREGSTEPRNLLPYALLELHFGSPTEAMNAYNEALPNLNDGDMLRRIGPFTSSTFRSTGIQLPVAIHMALGLAYGEESTWGGHTQYDKSLREFDSAITLQPQLPIANLLYGERLIANGRKAEGIAALKKASLLSTGGVKQAADEDLARMPLQP